MFVCVRVCVGVHVVVVVVMRTLFQGGGVVFKNIFPLELLCLIVDITFSRTKNTVLTIRWIVSCFCFDVLFSTGLGPVFCFTENFVSGQLLIIICDVWSGVVL